MASGNWPDAREGNFKIKNFQFNDGQSLQELRLHYRTIGTPKKDKNGRTSNAVLVMHGTTSSSAQFFCDAFAGHLFNKGQLLSAEDYFVVIRDAIGHGQSSKPSDGLRAKFPGYGYSDMVRADYMLLTEHLGVNHLRLVMGTSMGGAFQVGIASQSEADHREFAYRHAHLGLGDDIPRFHGRVDASRKSTDPDLRA